MYQAEYKGINSFLRDACRLLLKEGICRETRGMKCYELPEPVMFKISDPTARLVTIAERNWYAPLSYGESLWLAAGRNDMEYINLYGSNMKNFSDNCETMRGGYGPRLRHFNGSSIDYDIRQIREVFPMEVDQFRYVVECFKKDECTRQAIINIGDPIKDCFDKVGNLKVTKDIPCTRMLHFMKDAKERKLNLIVSMRSNDLIWGASAVNVFNFTLIQEYFSAILGMEIGCYYHIVNNLHYYENKREMVEAIAAVDEVEDEHFEYNKYFQSLEVFDKFIFELSKEEQKMRLEGDNYKYHSFSDPFIQDWYNVLYTRLTKRKIDFINPVLKSLII